MVRRRRTIELWHIQFLANLETSSIEGVGLVVRGRRRLGQGEDGDSRGRALRVKETNERYRKGKTGSCSIRNKSQKTGEGPPQRVSFTTSRKGILDRKIHGLKEGREKTQQGPIVAARKDQLGLLSLEQHRARNSAEVRRRCWKSGGR